MTPTDWIDRTARTLTIEADAPLDDLEPLLALTEGALIVGGGDGSRAAHEVTVLQERMARFLVTRAGFRTLAFDGDRELGEALDTFVRAGSGDPRRMLRDSEPFWNVASFLRLVLWSREFNRAHPGDEVRFLGANMGADAVAAWGVIPPSPDDPHNMHALERGFAERLAAWHTATGHRAFFWSTTSHASNGPGRAVHFPPSTPRGQRNAGSLLRDRFGSAYRPIGFTFGHGQVRAYGSGGVLDVPRPGGALVEHTLDAAGPPGPAYLLDLRTSAPPAFAAWRDAPARIRMVGPGYDPAHDADHCMTGGSLREWFDALVHVHEVTRTEPPS
ncbi:erythromycin esterase family protein [Streptomyces sp. NPDC058576]|uniref:erythromycin esterase family protein n=1 Tax=Streptomyces sp. NPDC058576 TaxID=3346547 RepID=UPI00366167DC